ncbi:hypothetical protein HDV04_002558 [Boothiomyces sp. JEL0838]|nr:hypothetical protein HDV04_002558 [Boothiomyces sp. JEL0838]
MNDRKPFTSNPFQKNKNAQELFKKSVTSTNDSKSAFASNTTNLVRTATQNDSNLPTEKQLMEIYKLIPDKKNQQQIYTVLLTRLKSKKEMHVYKALLIVLFLVGNKVGLEWIDERVFGYLKSKWGGRIGDTIDEIYSITGIDMDHIEFAEDFERDSIDSTTVQFSSIVRNIVKELILLLNDDSLLRERRQGRGQLNERMGYQSGFRRSNEEDADLRRAIEASKEQAAIDENRRRELQEEADLQRAIELSEKEALERRRMQMNNTGDSFVSPKGKKDDIIDFFGSLEQPAPIQQQDPFGAFGGFDPFQQQQQLLQQQQQQQMFMQQQMQQQFLMQEQQRLYNEQLQQQQMQQMMQQNPFGNMQQNNASAPHNPFAAPAPPPVQKPAPQKEVDLSSNPNAILDPFAAIAKVQTNPVGPNTQQFVGNTGSSNPFGMTQNQTGQSGNQMSGFGSMPQNQTGQPGNQMGGFGGFSQSNSSQTQFSQNQSPQQQNKQLFNLDASSLTSKSSTAAPKNPFSSTNTNHYQWEPQKPKPTLSELSGFTPMQPTNTGSFMTPSLTGNSQVKRNLIDLGSRDANRGLMIAIRYGRVDIVKFLLEHPIEFIAGNTATLFSGARIDENCVQVLDLLMDDSRPVWEEQDYSALVWITKFGRTAIEKYFDKVKVVSRRAVIKALKYTREIEKCLIELSSENPFPEILYFYCEHVHFDSFICLIQDPRARVNDRVVGLEVLERLLYSNAHQILAYIVDNNVLDFSDLHIRSELAFYLLKLQKYNDFEKLLAIGAVKLSTKFQSFIKHAPPKLTEKVVSLLLDDDIARDEAWQMCAVNAAKRQQWYTLVPILKNSLFYPSFDNNALLRAACGHENYQIIAQIVNHPLFKIANII